MACSGIYRVTNFVMGKITSKKALLPVHAAAAGGVANFRLEQSLTGLNLGASARLAYTNVRPKLSLEVCRIFSFSFKIFQQKIKTKLLLELKTK